MCVFFSDFVSITMLRRPSSLSTMFPERTWPTKAKFHVEPPLEGGTNVCLNGPSHMTKMAAMSLSGKSLRTSSLEPEVL